MTLFAPSFLDELRTGPDAPPTSLSADEEALRERLAAAVETQVPEVRDAVVNPLRRDTEGASWARAAVWGLSVARAAGFTAIGAIDDFAFRIAGAGGREAILAPLAFRTRGGQLGDPRHVAALERVLERSLTEHRYVLHVKKPLPPSFDPGPIGQAVQLWLLAMRQGTWRGRYAVYEDGDVAIEIGLTDAARREGAPGLLCRVSPHRSLERMAEVDARVVELAQAMAERAPGVPLVVLLAAQPAWRLARGYVSQLLYGTPREVVTERDGEQTAFQATYRPNGLALFSDPLSRSVGALWWAEPEGPAPGFRAWAHENPWCAHLGAVPAFPGRRFAAVGAPGPDGLAMLAWQGGATQ